MEKSEAKPPAENLNAENLPEEYLNAENRMRAKVSLPTI